ncbi:MAG: hypothetical protein IPQ04_04050 [Saprospiraceae bacterium]|nr:hypothetical protein [Saprospiraceae bacterium]
MKKLFTFVIFCLLHFSTTYAATITWTGATGGLWSAPANWSSGTTPISTDDVVIDGFAGTINIDVAVTINSLNVKNGANTSFTSAATRSFTLAAGVSAPSSNIDAGSNLTVGGSTINLIASSAFGPVFNVRGSLIFAGTASSRLDCQGGVTTIYGVLKYAVGSGNTAIGASPAYLVFADNCIFEIAKNGGSFPNATYQPNSKILISGTTSAGPTWNSSVLAYGNIDWNAPSQTAAGSFNINLTCNNFRILNSGTAELRISSGTTPYTLQVNGSYSQSSNTTLNIANGSASSYLKVKGDIVIDGKLTEGSTSTASGLELNGTILQNVSVAGTILNTLNVKINNPAGALLATDLTLPATGTLTLTNGKLTLGSFNLNHNNSTPASINGQTSSSYIVTNSTGSLNRNIAATTNSYDFPVGTSTEYQLANIVFTAAPASGVLSGRFIPSDPGSDGLPYTDPGSNNSNLNSVCPNGYWQINGSVGGTYDANFTTTGFSCLTDIANARVLKRASGTSTWDDPATTGTHVAGSGTTVSRSGFASFSEFGVAQGTAFLPLKLLAFNAISKGSFNQIDWIATDESLMTGYVLESSVDAVNFEQISFLPVKPSNTSQKKYQVIDTKKYLAPSVYYRLKETNFLSTQKVISGIVKVRNNSSQKEVAKIYPTASSDKINLEISSLVESTPVLVEMVDQLGITHMSSKFILTSGLNSFPLNIQNLANGIYFVRINFDSSPSVIQRFVKI